MKLLLAALLTLDIALTPHDQSESNYLNNIKALLHKQNFFDVLSLDSTTSNDTKLGYGYQVCEYFADGKSYKSVLNDLGISAANHPDNIPLSVYIVYYSTMSQAAVNNLCPQFKSKLNE